MPRPVTMPSSSPTPPPRPTVRPRLLAGPSRRSRYGGRGWRQARDLPARGSSEKSGQVQWLLTGLAGDGRTVTRPRSDRGDSASSHGDTDRALPVGPARANDVVGEHNPETGAWLVIFVGAGHNAGSVYCCTTIGSGFGLPRRPWRKCPRSAPVRSEIRSVGRPGRGAVSDHAFTGVGVLGRGVLASPADRWVRPTGSGRCGAAV